MKTGRCHRRAHSACRAGTAVALVVVSALAAACGGSTTSPKTAAPTGEPLLATVSGSGVTNVTSTGPPGPCPNLSAVTWTIPPTQVNMDSPSTVITVHAQVQVPGSNALCAAASAQSSKGESTPSQMIFVPGPPLQLVEVPTSTQTSGGQWRLQALEGFTAHETGNLTCSLPTPALRSTSSTSPSGFRQPAPCTSPGTRVYSAVANLVAWPCSSAPGQTYQGGCNAQGTVTLQAMPSK